ncbi:hypothetical protein M5689_019658 [Euphorbia peplus]|nr:hypothetical protein M5689_019658 [Euphorbia peplus]
MVPISGILNRIKEVVHKPVTHDEHLIPTGVVNNIAHDIQLQNRFDNLLRAENSEESDDDCEEEIIVEDPGLFEILLRIL